MKYEETIPSFATSWARELGGNSSNLIRLHGGINNHVYLCSNGSYTWIIKGYAQVQAGKRDRMLAEQHFLQFASEFAPGYTPALFHTDLNQRCLVLENINGRQFSEGTPPPTSAVASAVSFLNLLNRDPALARQAIQIDAAEGFHSLLQHINNIKERLMSMSTEHLLIADKPLAQAILQELTLRLSQVEEQTNRLIVDNIVTDAIDSNQCCISPGDFGFHNAIRTNKGVKFIDFEFAGWDDPAKTT